MVLQYVCIEKCFFDDKLIDKGRKLFLEDKVGDAFPHFRRVDNPAPKEMQEATPSKPNAKAPSSGGGAKASSGKVKGKSDDET